MFDICIYIYTYLFLIYPMFCLLQDGCILASFQKPVEYPPGAQAAASSGDGRAATHGDPGHQTLGLRMAQSRSDLYTLGPKVGITYILGAPGKPTSNL